MFCTSSLRHDVLPNALFLLLLSPLVLGLQKQYTVVNNCPAQIFMIIGENSAYYMNPDTTVVKVFDGSPPFFYTSTNGGSDGGSATRAGFYDDSNASKYYIVKDWNTFNVGMQIIPSHPEINGYCPVITCDSVDCTTAYEQPPTAIPVSNVKPPQPPLYSCPFPGVDYTIIFCPSRSFPGDFGRAAEIHPNHNSKKCMDVRGAVYADGTPVQIYDCNGTGAQKWISNKDFTKLRVAGTNYCLDMGGTDSNGVGLKIWTCDDTIGAQEWFAGSNGKIIHEGHPYCLDLPNGDVSNWNQLQLWDCQDGNTNQIWNKGT